MPKTLKYHYRDSRWPTRTLCGKEIEGTTGSPLNTDGTVAEDRVVDSRGNITCRTCFKSIAKGDSIDD